MGDLTAAGITLALARWLVWIGALLIVGSAGASALLRRADILRASPAQHTGDNVARLGAAGALLLTLGLAAVLVAQAVSWFGLADWLDADNLAILTTGTRWGQTWTIAAGAAVVALILTLAAVMRPARRGAMAIAAALLAALSVPLIGHGAGDGVLNWLLHATHLAGAGLWIGALAVLARATWLMWRDDSTSVETLTALLRRFSPLALSGAGLLIASGAILAVEHIAPLDALWTTPYGRTLLVKLTLVASVAAIGWRNWQRLVPAAAATGRTRPLRNSLKLELTVSLIGVLLVTAWLSGLPI
ncbi:MAG TPA: CopD family protein, partial [Vicinamibacterales bacterium]|nr:CopD family protein [Vicinamibacterales bacterium]